MPSFPGRRPGPLAFTAGTDHRPVFKNPEENYVFASHGPVTFKINTRHSPALGGLQIP